MVDLEKKGCMAVIVLNNPARLNALSGEMLLDLDRKLDEVLADSKVRVVVITGAGKAFVAGADIASMKEMSPAQAGEFSLRGSGVFRRMELADKIFIAAVNGFALGGGCELALACDIRIASDQAKFGLPEVGLGVFPGFSGVRRMMDIVGEAKAKELIFTGRTMDASEALGMGLVSEVVEAGHLLERVDEIASVILSKSFHAVVSAKRALNLCRNGEKADAVMAEHARRFGACFAHPDQKEGMLAFLEKRAPKFDGYEH